MKLTVTYMTKEKYWHTEHTYSHFQKTIEIEPLKIIRNPCGEGCAGKRYYYDAVFVAPDDAEWIGQDGLMREHIQRSKNPQFKPKKLKFDGRVCDLTTPEAPTL